QETLLEALPLSTSAPRARFNDCLFSWFVSHLGSETARTSGRENPPARGRLPDRRRTPAADAQTDRARHGKGHGARRPQRGHVSVEQRPADNEAYGRKQQAPHSGAQHAGFDRTVRAQQRPRKKRE